MSLFEAGDSLTENVDHRSDFSPFKISYSTCTATDALASEAAFMENIGLYLTPKPLLQNPRPPLPVGDFVSPKSNLSQSSNERASSSVENQSSVVSNVDTGTSHWEDELVLEWHYGDHEVFTPHNQTLEQQKRTPASPDSKCFVRSQPSLLSFLPNKHKSTDLSSVAGHLNPSISGQIEDQVNDVSGCVIEQQVVGEVNQIPKSGKSSEPFNNSNVIVGNKTTIDSDSEALNRDFQIPATQYDKDNTPLNINSQTDFMKQINLLNTSDKMPESGDSLMSPITPSKLKLWNPERESITHANFPTHSHDEIWKDVLDSSVVQAGKYCDI